MTINYFKVKNHSIKEIVDDQGKYTFSCDCPYHQEATFRKVPCKHVLSHLFANKDTVSWQYTRSIYAEQINTNDQMFAEMKLAKGLRLGNQQITQWYLKNTLLNTLEFKAKGNTFTGFSFSFPNDIKAKDKSNSNSNSISYDDNDYFIDEFDLF